ncbi:MAG: hypothetical protein ACKVVT_09015 [Dehalococcoidia bacterium]
MTETVDGEALIVDLATGTYYSAHGLAEYAWTALASGYTPEQVAAAVREGSDAGKPAVDQWLEDLVAQIMSDDLLQAGGAAPAAPLGPPPRIAFEPVLLRKFTDMQELLILDPIHDVDEAAGWPAAKP